MNKQRRKDIAAALELLSKARGMMEEASAAAAEAKDILETARDEEQEYKDNMPENMQDGDKGQMADSAIDNLEQAASSAESFIDALDESVSSIQEVIDKLEGDATSDMDEAENAADAATE